MAFPEWWHRVSVFRIRFWNIFVPKGEFFLKEFAACTIFQFRISCCDLEDLSFGCETDLPRRELIQEFRLWYMKSRSLCRTRRICLSALKHMKRLKRPLKSIAFVEKAECACGQGLLTWGVIWHSICSNVCCHLPFWQILHFLEWSGWLYKCNYFVRLKGY